MTPEQQSAAVIARNDAVIIEEYAVIIEEYAVHGLIPVMQTSGRPVSLYLARMLHLPIEAAFSDEEDAA